MKKISLVLLLLSNIIVAETLQDQYNDVEKQTNYNEVTYQSADGEVMVVFNQLKSPSQSNSGYISKIKLCNGYCKTYKFEPNETIVLEPNNLHYHMFTQKLDENITVNGFLCHNAPSINCHSYVTIEKDLNNKVDHLDLYYLDPAKTTTPLKVVH